MSELDYDPFNLPTDGNNPLTWVLLTPAERYDRDDVSHCPECGWPMKWREHSSSEHGHWFDGECQNSECGFTDGT